MNKYRTGKRPARHGAIRHKFRTFFDASSLPVPPTVFGRTSYFPEDGWGMLYNDRAGCCVVAGGMHETMLWNALGGRTAPPFADAQVVSDYSAITGYDPEQTDARGDNPTDQGTDMVAAAHYRQTKGLIDANGVRHTVDGYVSIEVGNVEELAFAAYYMNAVGVGATLPGDAEDQFDANQPWSSQLRGEDGHYFCVVGRNHEGNFLVVTWGRLHAVTPDWLRCYMDEGIVYISFESLRTDTLLSQRGMDVAGLRAAFGKFGCLRRCRLDRPPDHVLPLDAPAGYAKMSLFDELGDLARAVQHRAEIEALLAELVSLEPAAQRASAIFAQARALASVIAPDLIPSENYSVEFIQSALNDVAGEHLIVDGKCGPATTAAVERFQIAHKLHVDGWVGRETFDALYALSQAKT